jgi:hypothetical protein
LSTSHQPRQLTRIEEPLLQIIMSRKNHELNIPWRCGQQSINNLPPEGGTSELRRRLHLGQLPLPLFRLKVIFNFCKIQRCLEQKLEFFRNYYYEPWRLWMVFERNWTYVLKLPRRQISDFSTKLLSSLAAGNQTGKAVTRVQNFGNLHIFAFLTFFLKIILRWPVNDRTGRIFLRHRGSLGDLSNRFRLSLLQN